MNTVGVENCGILLLAAGISNRFGSPKQLLAFKGKTLLRHSVDEALATGLRPVIVVLGANSSLLEIELQDLKGINVIVNPGWEEGIASSIRAGLKKAMELSPVTDAMIIMVCDQPFISSGLLMEILQTQKRTGSPVVASNYNDNIGVPSLFHQSYFDRLLELKGDAGARNLLKQQRELIPTVEFPEGVIDIDTKEDYSELMANKKDIND